jgi:hypothetical protein
LKLPYLYALPRAYGQCLRLTLNGVDDSVAGMHPELHDHSYRRKSSTPVGCDFHACRTNSRGSGVFPVQSALLHFWFCQWKRRAVPLAIRRPRNKLFSFCYLCWRKGCNICPTYIIVAANILSTKCLEFWYQRTDSNGWDLQSPYWGTTTVSPGRSTIFCSMCSPRMTSL